MIAHTNSLLWVTVLIIFLGLVFALVLLWFFNLLTRLLSVLKFTLTAIFLKRLLLPGVLILTAYFLRLTGAYLIKSFAGIFSPYLDAFLSFGVIFFLLRLVDGLILVAFLRQKKPFPLPSVLHGFILALLYVIAIFIILKSQLKINITPFLATSALLTAILGLAFQGVLSNVMAGLSLNFSKAFQRGDWVQIGQLEGVVEEMNWRETVLLDRASNLVILPNSLVAAEKIINFSRPTKASALILEVKAGYENKPALVLNELKAAAKELSEVLSHPEPQALVAGYDHFGLIYWLKFWVKDFSRKNLILSEVARRVWYKLQRRGVKIPFPLTESLQEALARPKLEKPEAARKEEATKLSYLLNSNLWRDEPGDRAEKLIMNHEDLQELAARLKKESYTQGEILFRQGEKGDCCFVVGQGKLRVEIIYEEKEKKYLKELEIGAGGVVGEMSLFTGMPRTATVVVAEDAELLRITAEDFAYLLKKHPEMEEGLAEMISLRNQQNLDFLRKVQDISAQDIESAVNSSSIRARFRQLLAAIKEASDESWESSSKRGPQKIS